MWPKAKLYYLVLVYQQRAWPIVASQREALLEESDGVLEFFVALGWKMKSWSQGKGASDLSCNIKFQNFLKVFVSSHITDW